MRACDCQTGKRIGICEPDCASKARPHNPFQERAFVHALFEDMNRRSRTWDDMVTEAYRMNERIIAKRCTLTVCP